MSTGRNYETVIFVAIAPVTQWIICDYCIQSLHPAHTLLQWARSLLTSLRVIVGKAGTLVKGGHSLAQAHDSAAFCPVSSGPLMNSRGAYGGCGYVAALFCSLNVIILIRLMSFDLRIRSDSVICAFDGRKVFTCEARERS